MSPTTTLPTTTGPLMTTLGRASAMIVPATTTVGTVGRTRVTTTVATDTVEPLSRYGIR